MKIEDFITPPMPELYPEDVPALPGGSFKLVIKANGVDCVHEIDPGLLALQADSAEFIGSEVTAFMRMLLAEE